jgi:peptidoglycan/LPS O-acetylase OafA/YrhL
MIPGIRATRSRQSSRIRQQKGFSVVKTNETRREYLDGLRGLAALGVALSHTEGLFGTLTSPTIGYSQLSPLYYYGYRLINGNFPVCIFFVLSGFVLSSGYARTKDRNLLSEGALKRYFRLTPVAFTSIIFVYILSITVGYHAQEAARIMGGHSWLETIHTPEITLPQAIYQGMIGIYHKEYWYNGVLWTICIELYATIFLYAFIGLFGNSKLYPTLIAIAGVWLFWLLKSDGLYVCLFLAGSSSMIVPRVRKNWILVFPALYFGAYNPWVPEMSFWKTYINEDTLVF